MKWNEQFEKLRHIQATDAQKQRIYERITHKKQIKKHVHWPSVVVMCSVVLILAALLLIQWNSSVTTSSDERVVGHITHNKESFFFPVYMYTNVSTFTFEQATQIIDDILSGQRKGEEVPSSSNDTPGVSMSTSYVYVEEHGDVQLFEFQGDALYDVANGMRYPITEDEQLFFYALDTSLPTYMVGAIIIFVVWLIIEWIYYKQTEQKEKGVTDAPKNWRNAFYSVLTVLIVAMFSVLFGDLVLFKGWLLLPLVALSTMSMYMRRFLADNHTQYMMKTVTIILQCIASALFLLQL